MKRLFKKPWFIILIIIILVILLGIIFSSKKPKIASSVAEVKYGNVLKEVSVTGRVRSATNVDLAFERTGKVAKIYVKTGDQVLPGQILISLINNDLAAQLAQAQANVDSTQAKLLELQKGARQEDIAIKQSQLQAAQQSLINVYNQAFNVLNDAYNKADNALHAQTDALFSGPSDNPLLIFYTTNSQAKTDAEQQRILSMNELNSFRSEINLSSATNDQWDDLLQRADNHLAIIRSFLNTLNIALTGTIGLDATSLTTYQTNLNTARTNINTTIINVDTQRSNAASQKIAVATVQNELNLTLAGSTSENIAAQQAVVRQAQASVQNIQAQIDKTIIRSPINGIISKDDATVGEIVMADQNIISVILVNQFEVDTDVAEVDIASVKVGDLANITLDAYASDVIFPAKVISIDPGETIIDGVATYKTTLQFINEDARIKSGMTANIDILSDKRENVLILPQRAVSIDNNGKRIVQLIHSNSKDYKKNVEVQTGLKGSDGNIEIISGLNKGDKVMIQ
jgi:HlyD family secretion protein